MSRTPSHSPQRSSPGSLRLANASESPTLRMVLMRGLPGCGKTTTGKALAADGGALFEFDEFFYTQVGTESSQYDWSVGLLAPAREWNRARILEGVANRITPIIVDSDNAPSPYTCSFVEPAIEAGYEIEFREPDSPWWAQIRPLLANPCENADRLREWAHKLSVMSRANHRVPFEEIWHRVRTWQNFSNMDEFLRAATGRVGVS